MANPIKYLTFETFLGADHPLMDSIFFGSTTIPSFEIPQTIDLFLVYRAFTYLGINMMFP
jgi:hypothetical protein